MTGEDDLFLEGSAQQDKCEEQREVVEKEAASEKHVPGPTLRRRVSAAEH